MNNLGGFGNGIDRSSSLFGHVKVLRRDIEAPTAHLSSDRLASLVGGVEFTPAAPTVSEDVHDAEPAVAEPAAAEPAVAELAVAEPMEAAGEATSEGINEATDEDIIVQSDVTAPAAIENEDLSTTEVSEAGSGGLDAVARMLAMAQKLHDGYVTEGQEAREQLINEGQSHHDEVVAEATKKQEELLSTGQAKYDELVSVGEAMHDALISDAKAVVADAASEHERLITEARKASNDMIADARQRSTEVLETLNSERSLLQKGIEELRTFEDDHRARLKYYLQEQLAQLEQSATHDEA